MGARQIVPDPPPFVRRRRPGRRGRHRPPGTVFMGRDGGPGCARLGETVLREDGGRGWGRGWGQRNGGGGSGAAWVLPICSATCLERAGCVGRRRGLSRPRVGRASDAAVRALDSATLGTLAPRLLCPHDSPPVPDCRRGFLRIPRRQGPHHSMRLGHRPRMQNTGVSPGRVRIRASVAFSVSAAPEPSTTRTARGPGARPRRLASRGSRTVRGEVVTLTRKTPTVFRTGDRHADARTEATGTSDGGVEGTHADIRTGTVSAPGNPPSQ